MFSLISNLFHYYYYFVADTKNSVGLVGCIEEVAHNAIAVYWNPLESAAKVRSSNCVFYANKTMSTNVN